MVRKLYIYPGITGPRVSIFGGGANGEMANLTNEKGKFAIAIFRHWQFLKSDISEVKETKFYNHFTVYLSMPVVTLQGFKMIGRQEVGKLGSGPYILQVLNVFTYQRQTYWVDE